MKRLVPILATAALALSIPAGAAEKDKDSKKRSSKKETTKTTAVERTDVVTGVAETPAAATTTTTTTVPARTVVTQGSGATTPAGADTTGVARSTGAGIGEGSTRSDVGTGRGGAGIVRSGTLAPSATGETQVTTTVPAERTVVPGAGTVVEPTIPRATTNTGTLGSGTSTPAGVAPGK